MTAEVSVPESVLLPSLMIAEERSPKGPRPSKLIFLPRSKPVTEPSRNRAPAPKE